MRFHELQIEQTVPLADGPGRDPQPSILAGVLDFCISRRWRFCQRFVGWDYRVYRSLPLAAAARYAGWEFFSYMIRGAAIRAYSRLFSVTAMR